MGLKPEHESQYYETQIAGSHLRSSNSVGLGWGLQICISIIFSGDAMLVVRDHTLRAIGLGIGVNMCVSVCPQVNSHLRTIGMQNVSKVLFSSKTLRF